MVKKMFVRKGEQFVLIDLVIDSSNLDLWKSIMDYYPIWNDIEKNGIVVCSAEEYAKQFGFDVKKDSWEVCKLLGKLLYETDPLVISDTFKKLYEYVPKNDREKIFLENIFKCLSYKMPDIKIKPRCNIMNEVAGINYGDDSNVFNSIVDDMIDNEIECNPDISKKKIKKLRVNVRNSIPRKNALF